jgi:hypothetical protein
LFRRQYEFGPIVGSFIYFVAAETGFPGKAADKKTSNCLVRTRRPNDGNQYIAIGAY